MTTLFPGITQEVCSVAFDIQLAAFQSANRKGVTNRFAGTLVVVNPHATPSSPEAAIKEIDGNVLFARRVDRDYAQASRFDELALSKAAVLWTLRPVLGANFTTRDVQQNYPHLYLPGMVKYGGGVCRNGVVYAFSGVQANYDEAFALGVAVWVEAMCREAMVNPEVGVMSMNVPRVGVDTTHTMARVATSPSTNS